MKFEYALKALREGKKVKNSLYDYVYAITDNELCMANTTIVYKNGMWRSAELEGDEILAECWEVVDD